MKSCESVYGSFQYLERCFWFATLKFFLTLIYYHCECEIERRGVLFLIYFVLETEHFVFIGKFFL